MKLIKYLLFVLCLLLTSVTLLYSIEISEKDDWFVIMEGNLPTGYMHSTLKMINIEGETAYQITQEQVTRSISYGVVKDTVSKAVCEVNKDFSLRKITYATTTDNYGQVVEGMVENKELLLNITSGGSTVKKSLKLPAGKVYFLSHCPYAIALKGFEKGNSYVLRILVPEMYETVPISVKVIGEKTINIDNKEVNAIEVLASGLGFNINLFYTPNGDLLEVNSKEFGLQITKSKENLIPELVAKESSNILTNVKIENSDLVDYAKVKLTFKDIDVNNFKLESETQKIIEKKVENGNTVVILELRKKRFSSKKSLSLPIKDEKLLSYLDETPTVQCKDPVIRKKAEEIIGNEKNPYKAAMKILHWVCGNLHPDVIANIAGATAKEIMKNKGGLCAEYSTLFCALTRSIGIPTKINVGMKYFNSGKKFGEFGGHGWNEIYVGEWITIDPFNYTETAPLLNLKLAEADTDDINNKSGAAYVQFLRNENSKIEILDYHKEGKEEIRNVNLSIIDFKSIREKDFYLNNFKIVNKDEITQSLNVEIMLETKAGKEIKEINLNKKVQEFTIKTKNEVKSVNVDPNYLLLDTDRRRNIWPREMKPWIGIGFQPITKEESDSLGLVFNEKIIMINYVNPESPAEKAGLKKGDIVLNSGEIDYDKLGLKIGDKLKFTILRGKEKLDMVVTLEERP